jgi:Phage tail baseplate hub (GPD)
MTSVLVPAYELTLGSQIWKEQALEIRVGLAAAPLVDALTVRLPAAAPLSAAPGDPVSLTLDSGERKTTVFTGAVDSIRRGFDEIRVTALDAGGVLARYRPSATYEQVNAATVIRNLAGDAGLSTSDLDDGVDLAFYIADPSRTAWEHVARLAAWSGAMASVSSDNEVRAVVIDATQAHVALRYGREILSLQADDAASAVDAWVVAGDGGAGSAAAPEALRPSTDFFAGHRPDGPSLAHRWRFEPALRTTRAAGSAGAALQRQYAASRHSGRLRTFLQPTLRCGSVIEIQDLPAGLPAGPMWLARVDHVLGERGATTTVRFFKGGDTFDPLALLGPLAGAIGGLL